MTLDCDRFTQGELTALIEAAENVLPFCENANERGPLETALEKLKKQLKLLGP